MGVLRCSMIGSEDPVARQMLGRPTEAVRSGMATTTTTACPFSEVLVRSLTSSAPLSSEPSGSGPPF